MKEQNAWVTVAVVVIVAIVAGYFGMMAGGNALLAPSDSDEEPPVCPAVATDSSWINIPLSASVPYSGTGSAASIVNTLVDSLKSSCKTTCATIKCDQEKDLIKTDKENEVKCQAVRGCAYAGAFSGPDCSACENNNNFRCAIVSTGSNDECYYPAHCYNADGTIQPGCTGLCTRLPVAASTGYVKCNSDLSVSCNLKPVSCTGPGNASPPDATGQE